MARINPTVSSPYRLSSSEFALAIGDSSGEINRNASSVNERIIPLEIVLEIGLNIRSFEFGEFGEFGRGRGNLFFIKCNESFKLGNFFLGLLKILHNFLHGIGTHDLSHRI